MSSERQPSEAVPALPAPVTGKSDHNGWVVRPKRSPQATAITPTRRPKPRHRDGAAFAAREPMVPLAPADHEVRSRSWLALGLVGMVYVTGAAGLWSMVQAFEEDAPSTVVPVDDEGVMPMLDETIDVRDALLDKPFTPKLRPTNPLDVETDVASSGMRDQI